MALLEVENLQTWFYTDAGVLPSVDGVSFTIDGGQTLGVVGESGCGKSVTAMSILQLIPSLQARLSAGRFASRARTWLRWTPRGCSGSVGTRSA